MSDNARDALVKARERAQANAMQRSLFDAPPAPPPPRVVPLRRDRDQRTLGDARAWLQERLPDGAHCPCCEQFAKIYRRKLNSAMARSLILMTRLRPADSWIDLEELRREAVRRGFRWERADEAKLRFWGLLEGDAKATRRVDQVPAPPSGDWRVTLAGRAFVLREAKVNKYAVIYNQKLLRLEGPEIDIVEALGQRFDYSELMRGI